jgi:uncharacterized membrane protein YdjX (TVP38/TMEM64 family)
MRSARLFASARSKRILGASLVVLAAVFLGSAVLFSRYGAWLTDPFALREWIRGYGPFAPLVFVGLQAAQVILAPIPGQVLGLASGFLFGTFWGTVYSLIGATLGTIVAVALARRLGRRYVETIFSAETIVQFDAITEEDGPLALFLAFLLPGLPDDVICFLAGLTEIDYWTIVAISVVGRIPGYVVVNATGAGLASDRVLESVTVLLVLLALSSLVVRYRDALLKRLFPTGQR